MNENRFKRRNSHNEPGRAHILLLVVVAIVAVIGCSQPQNVKGERDSIEVDEIETLGGELRELERKVASLGEHRQAKTTASVDIDAIRQQVKALSEENAAFREKVMWLQERDPRLYPSVARKIDWETKFPAVVSMLGNDYSEVDVVASTSMGWYGDDESLWVTFTSGRVSHIEPHTNVHSDEPIPIFIRNYEPNELSKKIQLNMTKEEVLAKLGKPDTQALCDSCRHWKNETGEIFVAFYQDKAVGYHYRYRDDGNSGSGASGYGCPEFSGF